MTIPNFISLGRLLVVPIIIWLILAHHMQAAFYLFIAAGISDILDGLLARAFREQSIIGSYLDPIADKVLLMGVFVTLGTQSLLPLWLIIMILFRDLLILGGVLLLILFEKSLRLKPSMISKINTLIQIVLITYVLTEQAFNLGFPWIHNLLIVITSLTTILSGAGYVKIWVKHMKENEQS
ncbi:MAG: CDP-alcohol phosphatidyltransferase family protein [Alphaproteobacteria bacterium]|nr:CDP-alcohol phosphatidyltransferase family protein [Alphaproteobacteria bacterium]